MIANILQELGYCWGISVPVVIVCHSLQEHLADGSQGDIVYKALLERAAAEPVRCCSNGCQLAQGEALAGDKAEPITSCCSAAVVEKCVALFKLLLPRQETLACFAPSFPAASLLV